MTKKKENYNHSNDSSFFVEGYLANKKPHTSREQNKRDNSHYNFDGKNKIEKEKEKPFIEKYLFLDLNKNLNLSQTMKSGRNHD